MSPEELVAADVAEIDAARRRVGVGHRVEVTRGVFAGERGTVTLRARGSGTLLVRLDSRGCALAFAPVEVVRIDGHA